MLQYFTSLFKKCSTLSDIKQIHARVVRTGSIENKSKNLFVIGKIINFCAVSVHGDMGYAVKIFENTGKPDGFLWNTMIRGFGNLGQHERAFVYYKRMLDEGVVADNFTFSFLLKASWHLGSVPLSKQLHCSTVKCGWDKHDFVRNSLVHMYGMIMDMEAAMQLFDEMPEPNLVAWNTVLDCHVSCGRCKEALDVFANMLRSGIGPDEATLVVVLSACSQVGALDYGRWLHDLIDPTGLSDIVPVRNACIDMYAKCGAVGEAYMVFADTSPKNRITWNTMILGLAMHGHSKDALKLFSRMLEDGSQEPDGVTFLGVLCACNHGGMVDEGRRHFESMRRDYHIEPTIRHYGCMVDMLGRAGFLEEAYQLIRSMPIRCNAIVWRSLLGACRIHGNIELGETVRKKLLQLEPDHSSDYVQLSSMYASVGQWNSVLNARRSMNDRGAEKPKPGYSFVGVDDLSDGVICSI
ncbi:pentatricopeptide repeat-containing protein At4g21065-like [Rhodamnia argentea]|uniref:Pentatricopeptide repeat-containing protein At4g21065-like n=1 Tax=Rhodamnia argentea TaxID=178133 RepID=A0A8B8PIP5_9MYRT|nr:pentatricopeptide repeat-containing protein At4g21065-like [Rhodamnia argentea]